MEGGIFATVTLNLFQGLGQEDAENEFSMTSEKLIISINIICSSDKK